MKVFGLLFIFSFSAYAYVYSKSQRGDNVRWEATSLKLYAHSSGSDNLERSEVEQALEESVEEWRKAGSIGLEPVYVDNPPPLGQGASLSFSSDPAYFSPGILAITSISYNQATGVIYSGDIYVNNEASFTSDRRYRAVSFPYRSYIGDVLSHELGHLLGLNHSETFGATMVFSDFRGQFSLHSDDVLGLADLYSHSYASSIKGKVVGKGELPVFGAHVQAVDLEESRVVAGVFTENDGSFWIKGLDPERSYALYMAPMRNQASMPERFHSAYLRFCDGQKLFAPSFFSKCGGRAAGRAQALRPGYGALDVGNFTVRCSSPVEPAYMSQKFDAGARFKVFDFLEEYKTAFTFSGFFSEDQVASGGADRLRFDFSGLDASKRPELYVRFRVSTESLGTAVRPIVHLPGQSESFRAGQDPETGKPLMDVSFRLPLLENSNLNVFELDIFGEKLGEAEKQALFASDVLINKASPYLLSAQVVTLESGVETPIVLWDDYPYQDNTQCLEGQPPHSEHGGPTSKSEALKSQEPAPLSCATIDVNGGGPSGGIGSFFIGLCIALALLAPRPRRNDFFV